MHHSIQALILSALVLAFTACTKHLTPVEEGNRTQTLLLGNAAEPADLDPGTINASTDGVIACALFEPLTWIDEKTTTPIPAAAERWDKSQDGLVWTFHLRPGMHWSNGDKLTAQDWVYSLHRILSPNLGAASAFMVWPVKNAEAFNAGKITDFSSVGVKALDELTLQLTLERPTAYLPALVAHPTWLPVHQATIEKFGKMDQKGTRWTRPGNLVGNGPFILTDWSPNSRITVAKNPQYWDAAKVRLNQIVFFPIEDANSEERNFRAGQLHVTWGLPLSKIEVYKKDHPNELRIESQLASYFLYFNTTKKPFDDWRVRRALAMAVDRPRISNQVTKGVRSPAYFMTPPDCGGYTCTSPMPDDFEAARKLMADAGYPHGQGLPTVEVLSYSTEVATRTLEVVQDGWARELGFHIQIVPTEQKTLFARSQTGDYSIAFSAWVADYPDPSSFLECLHTGNGDNWSRYTNPQYDRLLNGAANALDTPVRYADFQKAEAIIMHDAPLVPLFFGQRPHAIQPTVHGWTNSKLAYKAFKNIWLGP